MNFKIAVVQLGAIPREMNSNARGASRWFMMAKACCVIVCIQIAAAESLQVQPDISSPQRTVSSYEADAYLCQWTAQKLVIDGKLSEEAWRHAQILNEFVVPGSKKQATTKTVAKLCWGNEGLYFGATIEDADIYGFHKGHDSPFGGEDVIELFIKPRHDQPAYWEFHITPRGATRDYSIARRNAGLPERWLAYNSGMRAAVMIDGTLNHWEDRDKMWTVEMAIPWAAFNTKKGGKPVPGAQWLFMVARYEYSVYLEEGLQLSASSILPEVNFHLLEHYRNLIFEGPQ